MIASWFLLVGPTFFFALLLPCSLLAAAHLVHFNWSTHNAYSPSADYKPVNLNHGYFKLGNKLFFGIYMHANHHKWPNVLNPAQAKHQQPITPGPTAEDLVALRKLRREWDYSRPDGVAS